MPHLLMAPAASGYVGTRLPRLQAVLVLIAIWLAITGGAGAVSVAGGLASAVLVLVARRRAVTGGAGAVSIAGGLARAVLVLVARRRAVTGGAGAVSVAGGLAGAGWFGQRLGRCGQLRLVTCRVLTTEGLRIL